MSYDGLLINACSLIYSTKDKWGNITGTAVLPGVKCRIEYGTRLVTDYKGEQVVSIATVFFRKNAVLEHDTLVRIGSRDHAIAQIFEEQDSVAVHHKEALIT
jgi:hypothetical protein